MMIGVDYPHHEGMWNGGTRNYLQATFGANRVPVDEARLISLPDEGVTFSAQDLETSGYCSLRPCRSGLRRLRCLP